MLGSGLIAKARSLRERSGARCTLHGGSFPEKAQTNEENNDVEDEGGSHEEELGDGHSAGHEGLGRAFFETRNPRS